MNSKTFVMKKMRGLFLVVLVLAFQLSNAQLKGFSLGPYVEAGWPAGNDFKTTHKYGLGAGLTADIKLPGALGLTGSAGYMQFMGKTITTAEGTQKAPAIKAFPIRAGLKLRVAPLIYFKLEGGAANFTDGESGSAFIASPGIGVRLLMFDFQAKYEAWLKNGSNISFWGLRAGLNF
jgi:hypothetical protein